MRTLEIDLPVALAERLTGAASRRGVPGEKLVLELLDQHLPIPGRQAELVSLLQSWVEEGDPEEQRETGEYLIRSLDEDRLGDRKLFPSELQGLTW